MGIFSMKSYASRIGLAFSALDKVYTDNSLAVQDIHGNKPYVEAPFIGNIAFQGHEVIADTSSTLRITAFANDPKYAATSSAVGVTSCWNAFQGIFGFIVAKKAYEAADSKNDLVGARMSFLDMVLRVSQFTGGIAFFQIRFSGIMSGFSALKDVSLPVKECAMVVSACFSTVFISLAFLSFLALSENICFVRKNKEAVKGDQDALLQKRIGQLTGKIRKDPSKPLTKKQLYVHTGEQLRGMLCEIDTSLVDGISDYRLGSALFTTEEGRRYLQPVLTRMGYSETVTGTTEDELIQELRDEEVLKANILYAEQRVAYRRIVGGKGVELIEKARKMELHTLLQSEDQEVKTYAQEVAKDLIEKLRVSAKEQRPMMWAYLTCGIFGAFILMVDYTVTLPMHVIIEAASFAICFVTMGYGDYCCFKGGLASDGPIGKWAINYSYIHLALGVLAISTAIALTVLSSGTFPIVLVALVGTVWICMDLYIIYTLRQKAQEYEQNHPTLQRFEAQLQKAKSADSAYKGITETTEAAEKVRLQTEQFAEKRELIHMFLRLSKLQRRALLASLRLEDQDRSLIDTLKTEMEKVRSHLEDDSIFLDNQDQKQLVESILLEAQEGLLLGEGSAPTSISEWKNHPCYPLFKEFCEEKLIQHYEERFLRGIDLQKIEGACKILRENLSIALQPPQKKVFSKNGYVEVLNPVLETS